MKYYKLNDVDAIIALNEEDAIEKFKKLMGIEINENYTEEEFRDEFELHDIEAKELSEVKVYDGDSREDELITAEEFVKRYPDLESPHFTSEM